MNAEKMIKEQAKYQLSGKWAAALAGAAAFAIVPCIVLMLVESAYAIIGETPVRDLFSDSPVLGILFVMIHLAAVAVLLLLSPAFTGMVRLYSKIANGDDVEVSDAFYFFESKKRYGDAVAFMSLLLLKTLGIIVACEAASVALFISAQPDQTAGNDSDLIFIASFLAIAGAIGAYLWLHRFTFQVMLFSYYEYDGAEAVKVGGEIVSGNMGKLLKLTFTFAIWLLFSLLLFPLIYVFPYITCARLTSAKYIIAGYLESRKNEPVENPFSDASYSDPEPEVDTAAEDNTNDTEPVVDMTAEDTTSDSEPVVDTPADITTNDNDSAVETPAEDTINDAESETV